MGSRAAKLKPTAIRVVHSVSSGMKGRGERSERMDRRQKGRIKTRCQRHISVLLVFNRDYFPFAQLVTGGSRLHM